MSRQRPFDGYWRSGRRLQVWPFPGCPWDRREWKAAHLRNMRSFFSGPLAGKYLCGLSAGISPVEVFQSAISPVTIGPDYARRPHCGGELVKRRAFPSPQSYGMLGYEFCPIHQSFAHGRCDRWARYFAADHASCGKAAAGCRDERYVDDVRRHALLSGYSEEQRLPGLSASRDVRVGRCTGAASCGNRNPDASVISPSAHGFRRSDRRWPRRFSTGSPASKPGLTGA